MVSHSSGWDTQGHDADPVLWVLGELFAQPDVPYLALLPEAAHLRVEPLHDLMVVAGNDPVKLHDVDIVRSQGAKALLHRPGELLRLPELLSVLVYPLGGQDVGVPGYALQATAQDRFAVAVGGGGVE